MGEPRLPEWTSEYGIVAVDELGIIRLCNQTAEELFGRPADELVGSPFGFPLTAGASTDLDLAIPGKRKRVVEMRVTTMNLEGEQLYLVVLRDAARRRKAELKLSRALERQNTVIAMAAHELSSPLAAIGALASTLRDPEARLSEERRAQALDRIAERTAYLQELVRRLLTASRLEARTEPGHMARVSVLELVLGRLADREDPAREVRVSCPSDLDVLADRSELFEMLSNYLDNAFAYGRPPIDIRAQPEDGARVVIRVCDHGPGVPEEFLPDLFERFTRAPSAARQAEGTGLGLWIVRTLARANHGTAWYEPSEEGGACFCLGLSRAR
ncbi:hypothetical protein GCM10010191_46810 [Actinomadura vinacea]|uniref:histidine kinase n=1 Tax=Actinomadura vinacea TaxID=115336 RepID=A0ABP5WM68_9ACTN